MKKTPIKWGISWWDRDEWLGLQSYRWDNMLPLMKDRKISKKREF